MRLILALVKLIVSAILGVYVFQKIKSFMLTNPDIKAIALSKKDKIKAFVKRFEEHSFNLKLFNKLRLNCNKLGINIFGIEILVLIAGITIAIILFNVFNIIFKIKTVAVILSVPFIFSGFIVIQYF